MTDAIFTKKTSYNNSISCYTYNWYDNTNANPSCIDIHDC